MFEKPRANESRGARAVIDSDVSSDDASAKSTPRSRRAGITALAGACRWILVVAFLVSGVGKLLGIDAFGGTLAAMGFFSTTGVQFLKWALPLLEIIAATSLALRRLETLGLAIAMFLSAAFAGLHAYLHLNGIIVPCGCAGISEVISPDGNHLTLAIFCGALFICGAILACLGPRRRSA